MQAQPIHRQQLFHWIGDDLDKQNRGRKQLRDGLVDEYIKRLVGSLKNGIWVNIPRKPEEFIFENKHFSLQLPIACFTEWSLGDSLSHTGKYGRMGFGFPKRWVIEQGGQSVSYFNHKQKSGLLRKIFKLLALVGEEKEGGVWEAKPGIKAADELIYLLHFAKMIRAHKEKRTKKKAVRKIDPEKSPVPIRKLTQATKDAINWRRRFGAPLPFVEECEWRIVYDKASKKFKVGPQEEGPSYYLPYTPGNDLFTLVLPDNKVVSKVMEITEITERLFQPWKHCPTLRDRHVPPVTVLAHCDIGTF